MEQPGLVTSPRSHQPIAKHPQADNDNSIYFPGQGRLFPLSWVTTWLRRLWLPNVSGLVWPRGKARQVVTWGHGNAAQGTAGCPTLTWDASVVVVEGKLPDVTPGNWKMQGWNSEGEIIPLVSFLLKEK